jgi:hypothetical protein
MSLPHPVLGGAARNRMSPRLSSVSKHAPVKSISLKLQR